MTTTDLSPLGLRDTPSGTLPCAVCGIPTTGRPMPHPVLSRMIATGAGERAETLADGASIDLPTCRDCRDIAETARAIVAEHPGIIRLLGTVATWQLTTSLYALSALGTRLPGPDIQPHRLGSLIRHLAVPGGMATYSRRFSPVLLAGSSTKQSARERWSAVLPSVLADCRAGASDWLADGRPARALPHPGRLRCDWCGTATAYGVRVSEAWFGKLCVTCHAVRESGGTVEDAVWQAIDPDRTIRRRRMDPPRLQGALAFSQAGGGDGSEWSHLGDLEDLRVHVTHLVEAS